MDDLLDNLKKLMKNPSTPGSLCVPIVNLVCSSGGKTDQHTPTRSCIPTELIRNGSFEQGGEFSIFRDWEQDLDPDIELDRDEDIAYEGTWAAEFLSLSTADVESKFGSIRQSVVAPSGCFLSLSFADNFVRAGEGFEDLDVSVRVFYTDAGGNRVNLINIEIDYNEEQAGKGYVFHQKVSDAPVPLNVSSVTVEFRVQIEDESNTSWFLDGVSLRAI
jgi:hypothetical protein